MKPHSFRFNYMLRVLDSLESPKFYKSNREYPSSNYSLTTNEFEATILSEDDLQELFRKPNELSHLFTCLVILDNGTYGPQFVGEIFFDDLSHIFEEE